MSEPAVLDDNDPDARPPMSLGARLLRMALGLFAGLGVMVLVGWWMKIDPAEVARYAAGVPPWAVAGCVGSAFVVLAFQALRWHLVMSPLLGLSYGQAYRAQIIGQMFNAILPARGGDLLRVQYLGRRSGKSRATILGTEIVDRWLDWWGWIPILAVLTVVGDLPGWIYKALGIFSGILVAWGTTMVVLSKRGFRPRPGSRLGAVYDSFRTGVEVFRSKRTLAIALAVAPLCWAWEALALVFAAKAFGIDLTVGMAFSVMIGFNLATVVPSAGGIGSVETGGTAALVFFGVDKSRALAFMFIYHFSQLLPSIAAGAAILVAEGESMFGGGKGKAAERAAPEARP